MQYFTAAIAFIFFFASCSDSSKNELTVFRSLTKSFEESNRTSSSSNGIMYKTLENRLSEPKTAAFADVWQPKATEVSNLVMPIIKFIGTMKTDLILESDLKDDNVEAVKEIFFQKNRGVELYNKLRVFIARIKVIDEQITLHFDNDINRILNYVDSGKNIAKAFTNRFFNKSSVIKTLLILEKFENDILNIENKMVSFCFYRTAPIDHGYKLFSAIVGQTSNCVKAGDNIEIFAGVGAFSIASNPKINIDRKNIELNPDGVAVYKFKTPVKAGKYFKNVKIEYTEPDGTKEAKTFNIEYTVIDPDHPPK